MGQSQSRDGGDATTAPRGGGEGGRPSLGAHPRAEHERRSLGCARHPSPPTGGKILFGSQTGTARRLAHKLSNSLRTRHGIDLEVVDLAAYDPEDLVREPVALIILSTYEDAGAPVPPESARYFCQWARESSQDERFECSSSRTPSAVFGCGNREYGDERFNAAARALDADVARLGGERLLRRADGDESSGRMEEQFHDWADRLAFDSVPPRGTRARIHPTLEGRRAATGAHVRCLPRGRRDNGGGGGRGVRHGRGGGLWRRRMETTAV